MGKSSALVLEDCDIRIRTLQELRFFDKVIHCRTVKEFEEAFSERSKHDLLILDHDLGGETYNSKDPDGKTGQHAVTFLCRLETKLPPVLVWSCNPTGGEMMAKRLVGGGHKACWVPFFRFVDRPKEYLNTAVNL